MATTSWFPKTRLTGPACQSVEDVELALAELAAITTRENALDAELTKAVDHIKAGHDKQLVTPDGERFADRIATLKTAVLDYAAKHRGELLTGKTKSRELTHGTISWKKQPEKLGFAEGLNDAAVIAKLDKARNVNKLLVAALKAINWFGSHLGVFLVVSVKLDKNGILAAWKADELNAKQLDKAGLTIAGGGEAIAIKLNEYKPRPAA